MNTIDVYLEIGTKRTFAGALGWPGWCRSGRDEETALQALIDYAPRYARVLRLMEVAFQPPGDRNTLLVVERLEGDMTTNFGAPGHVPTSDSRLVSEAELGQLQAVLSACWQAFDEAIQAAEGKELRRGPRGGGRDLLEITRHVLDAQAGYLSRIGWNTGATDLSETAGEDLRAKKSRVWQAVLKGLAASARGELPTRGPRGGIYWSPRYFSRRSAWHILDHAWEIEDRVQ